MTKLKDLGQRIKENFRKNKVVFFIFVVIWFAVVVLTINVNSSTLSKKSEGNQYDDCVVEINRNNYIKEILPINQGSTDLAFKIATYKRNNNGNLKVVVMGEDSKITYANVVANVKEIQDNAFFSFSLSETLNKKNDEKIQIEITSDSAEGEGVGVYYCLNNEVFENGELFINDEKVDGGDLTLRFLKPDSQFAKFSNTILICSITIITILILVLLLIRPKYEIFFPMIVFFIGLIFMFIITPLSPPDEQAHYEASLQLTNYVLSNDYHTVIDKAYVNYSHYYGHYNISTAYTRLLEQFNNPLELKGKTIQITNDISGQYWLYYVPQTVGILIGRVLKLNVMKTFYLGRFTNLIFYCICLYLSIKKTPINKLLFGIIGCLPIFIQTAASNSYDCFVVALCMLNAAILFKWIYDEDTIKPLDYILALFISAGLAPAKYVYGFLSLLFIFVPYKKYGSKAKKYIFTLILCMPALLILCPILIPRIKALFESLISSNPIINTINAQTNNGTIIFKLDGNIENLGENYSLGYVFSHLRETIQFVLFTIRYNIKPWFYGAIGRGLSGTTLSLPLWLTYLIILLVLTSTFSKEKHSHSMSFRIFVIGLCVLMGLLIVGGMLLYWTKIGDFYIQGVQGRYFSPFIIYFFTIFNNKKIGIPEKFDKYTIFAYLIMIFEVIVYVLSYTFVN